MQDLSRYNNAKHRLAALVVLAILGLLCWQLGFGWTLALVGVVVSVVVYRYVSRKNAAELAKSRLLRERQAELAFHADQTGRAAAGQRAAT